MIASGPEMAARTGSYGDYVRCRYCVEPIRREAVKCRYCASSLPPVATREPAGGLEQPARWRPRMPTLLPQSWTGTPR